MSALPQPRLTPEQYLEIERAAQFRSEYYNGRMYAMSGGSYPHAVIISNLNRELGTTLRGRCIVTASDTRVLTPDGLYTYPDVVVTCGQAKFSDSVTDTIVNPILLIEVLSRSTEGYDRGFKSGQYRRIESLEEYALVSQAEPRVEVFRRQPGGHWLFTEFIGMKAACDFESVNAAIRVADIYENVVFDEQTTPDKDDLSAQA